MKIKSMIISKKHHIFPYLITLLKYFSFYAMKLEEKIIILSRQCIYIFLSTLLNMYKVKK